MGVYPGDGDLLDPFIAPDLSDGMGQIKGDIVIIQTLDDIAGQAARIRHQFNTSQYLSLIHISRAFPLVPCMMATIIMAIRANTDSGKNRNISP